MQWFGAHAARFARNNNKQCSRPSLNVASVCTRNMAQRPNGTGKREPPNNTQHARAAQNHHAGCGPASAQQSQGEYCAGSITSITCTVDSSGYIIALSFTGDDGWYFRPTGGSRVGYLGVPGAAGSSNTKVLTVPAASPGIVRAWVGADDAGARVSSLLLQLDGERAPWSCGTARTARYTAFAGSADGAGSLGVGRLVPVLCGIGGRVGRDGRVGGSLQALTSFSFSSECCFW